MIGFAFDCPYTPIVQIGIGDSRVDEDAGQWNVDDWDDAGATWAGTAPFWLDITAKVFELETFYGRQRTTDLFEVGTATLLVDNSDGWGDPVPPDDDPAFLTLRAGRPIRVALSHATKPTRVLWYGYIDSTEPVYDANDFEQVTITAVCALGEAGRAPLAELAAPVGASELAGTRIARILNAAKWPAAQRVIETTGVTMLSTVLGDQTADMLQVTAESVGGAVYGDEAGRVVFRGRDWQLFEPDEPLDGTIGNFPGVETFVPPVESSAGLWDFDNALMNEVPVGAGTWEWIAP